MRNVTVQRLSLSIGIALIALAASCRSPLSNLAEPAGTLTVTLPASASARATPAASSRGLADHAGSIAAWRIEGTGPNGRTHDKTYPATDVSNNTLTIQLYLGDWQLTIKGLDADGTVAFTATQNVTVSLEETATCAMTLQWAEKALVARLSFDDTIKDDKGRVTTTPSDTGTWTPTASTASAPSLDSEKYLSFSGSEYIDVSPQELGTDISVSLWVGPNATTDQGVIITSQEGEQVNTPGFSIALYTSTSPLIGLYYLDGVTTTAIDEAQYIPSRWNHITVTIDNTNRSISLFVNGTKVGTNNLSYTIPVNQAIRIGNNKNGSEAFTGSLDDVRIYAGALSADDIAAIYADGYFSGGLGTAQAPYLVATPMDLFNLRHYPSAYYRQTAPIDLGSNDMTRTWIPFPIPGSICFTGNYDGGGLTISNLKLADGATFTGLFESLDGGSVVKNLTLRGSSDQVAVTKPAGALAGRIWGATVSDVTVSGFKLATSAECLGGLASEIFGTTSHSATVSNVTISDSSLSGASKVGGLAGYAYSDDSHVALMTDCTISSTTSITATGANVGGFVGHAASFSRFSNCVTDASVKKTDTSNSIGGFIGYISEASYTDTIDISNCHARGNVDAPGQYIGGFIGCFSSQYLSAEIKNCSARGNVSGRTFVGGFLGSTPIVDKIIALTDCSAYGNVTATENAVGGFTGNILNVAGTVTMLRCQANGAVSGPSSVGGFIGSTNGNADMDQCFARGLATGTGNSIGGFIGNFIKGSIDDCYAQGGASGPAAITGVAGFAGFTADNGATIKTSYCSGNITNGRGAFIGGTLPNQTLSVEASCYWDASGNSQIGELGNPSNASVTGTIQGPEGFNFMGTTNPQDFNGDIWRLVAGSYPRLKWEPVP